MSEISPYEFVGTPIENINNTIKFPIEIFPRAYNKILFHDSIFDFYPTLDISLTDEIGTIIDKLFFVEGMEWNFKLGSSEYKIKRKNKEEALGYLNQNYCWSQNRFNCSKIFTSLSGINNFSIISSYYKKDDYKSRINKNSKVSDAVRTTIKDYGVIADSKLFISTTIGNNYWPQYSILNEVFLKKLTQAAYQSNNSPFLTFFNSNSDFYFMSLSDIYKQDSIGTFSLKFSESSTADDWAIQDYKLIEKGMYDNKKNYKKTGFRLNDDGIIVSTDHLLKDFYIKQNSQDKFLVRTKDIADKHYSENLGIIESAENDLYNAKVNKLFLDSNFSHQMEIIVRFNPQLVSGKIINIEIGKSDSTAKMLEFTGNWLICESQHLCDNNGLPVSKLFIAKSAIKINQQNPYYGEFI